MLFALALLLVLERTGNYYSRVVLLEMRQILFGVRFANGQFLSAKPRELEEQYAFETYDPSSINRYRPNLNSILNRESMQGRIDNFDKWASDVTQMISGFGGRACGEYENLLDAIGRLVHGDDGCCSDHTMVFLAIAAFDGVFARELHNAEHTFVEYWNPNEQRYVWLDPYLALRAVKNGKYLSLSEMLDLIDHSNDWEFEFIGAENPVRKLDLKQVAGLRPQDFAKIGMTLGNDVYAEDLADQNLRFFSRPIAQALLLITRKKPAIGFSYERTSTHRPTNYYYDFLRYLLIFQAIIVSIIVLGAARGIINRKRSTI